MTDKLKNNSTDKSTGKSKNYVPLAAIILGAPILVIVFLVVMRCAFEPPARISVMRESTTQPVPFDAERREQVRDFVADEIDRQTGQSHQQFNALASALIAVASTILLATIGILALGWWRQRQEHKEEAEEYRTTFKKAVEQIAEDEKRSKEYLEQAKEHLEQVKGAAKSSEASRRFMQALTYESEGELDRAIEEYSRSIAAEETHEAYNNRGNAWVRKGDFGKAIADYDKAIELNPKFAAAYNNRGNRRVDKGELDKAITDYNKAIELAPKYAAAYSNRGVARYKKGEFDDAIEDYNKAIELNPKYAAAYNNRGNAWADKGEFDKAIKDYNKAIELDPTDARFYNGRGNAWTKKGEFDNAIADFTKAIELAPNYATAYSNRGSAWAEKGEFDKAIADYNKAIELDPKYAAAYNNRGAAWYKKDEFGKAIADYNKAIELDPKDAAAYNNRGAAWAKKGELDKAVKDYDKAIELDSKDAGSYLNTAEALITLKQDFHGAVERLEQGRGHNAFENDRNRLVASYLEGIALALNGDDASAAEAEVKRLLAGGAKASDWDTEQMARFLKDLKPKDFAPAALETARRIQEMLKIK